MILAFRYPFSPPLALHVPSDNLAHPDASLVQTA
jgi:hypothetical protein